MRSPSKPPRSLSEPPDLSWARPYFEQNQAKWQEFARVNPSSPDYNLAGLRAGTSRLHAIEAGELGSVDGLDVLHLQCHFGVDSLILAQQGARVTGLDFAPRAIATARALADELGLDARFVDGNLYDARDLIEDRFDLVFVSWGALNWLPDIGEWARVVAHFIKPGGRFYLAEWHPAAAIFDDDQPAELVVAYDYFYNDSPSAFDSAESYVGGTEALAVARAYEWFHPIGDVVTALIEAGLTLDFLHEHDRVAWRALPFLEAAERGLWRMPEGRPRIPLSYSLSAHKPVEK